MCKNSTKEKMRHLIVTFISVTCIILLVTACIHKYKSAPKAKIYTDTLWAIPSYPLHPSKRMMKYALIHYELIDSSFRFVERDILYTGITSEDEYGTIKIGNREYLNERYRYGMIKVDSLHYDIVLFSIFRQIECPFRGRRSSYINLYDKYAHDVYLYPPFWSRLRFIESRKNLNDQKRVKQYHVFYGQDIGMNVLGKDSLYFYYDKDMCLKKVLRKNNSIVLSTLEDMNFK